LTGVDLREGARRRETGGRVAAGSIVDLLAHTCVLAS